MADYERHGSNYTGILKWLDATGFGYIVNGDIEHLVTPSSLTSKTILEGDEVSYYVTRVSYGRYEAVRVRTSGIECYRCERTGHLFHDCPSFVGYFWIKCRKCGFTGHNADNCVQKFFGFSIGKTRDDYNRFIVRSCNCRYGCWSSLFGGPCTKFGNVKTHLRLGSNPLGFDWPPLPKGLASSQQRADRTREKRPEQSRFKTNNDFNDDESGHGVSVKVEDVKRVEEVENCFILDFDPNKLPNLESLNICDSSQGGNDNDDDLIILAQKGEVACRDYAHPRYLCAINSFEKTPHVSHCEMCYCYVCDVPAPCKKWTNVSKDRRLNHCDACHNDEYWRLERDVAKISEFNTFSDSTGS